MYRRAFVVAVEKYDPDCQDFSTLTGVHAAAECFLTWLIDIVKVDEIFCCATGLTVPAPQNPPGPIIHTYGTDRDEVKQALSDVRDIVLGYRGSVVTDELFCYFAGHGFRFKGSSGARDHLVLSDFVDPGVDGDKILGLDDTRDNFRVGLGFGEQYYFIDACRNEVWDEQDHIITPAGRHVTITPIQGSTPAQEYYLSATPPGDATWTRNDFIDHLVKGLGGDGEAKDWVANDMYVQFNLLSAYVFKRTTKGESRPGGSGEILKLHPVPPCAGTIKVVGANASDQTTVEAWLGGMRQSFSGFGDEFPTPPHLLPRHYDDFTASLGPTALVRDLPDPSLPHKGFPRFACYEPFTVRFKLPVGASTGGPPASGSAPDSSLEVLAVDDTEVELYDPASAQTRRQPAPFLDSVPPGEYVASLLQDGAILDQRRVEIDPGESKRLNLGELARDRTVEEIARDLMENPHARGELFGDFEVPNAENWDVAQWVALLGAAHLMGDPGSLRSLPQHILPRFRSPDEGEGALWVISRYELEQDPSLFQFEGIPQRLLRGPAVYGLDQWVNHMRSGPFLCTVRAGSWSPVTFVSHILPNRATLLTLTESPSGALRIHQYLLPMENEGPRFPRPLGPAVRTMYLAQRFFARNLALPPSFGKQRMSDWRQIVTGQWSDPLLNLIFAFDIIRQGGRRDTDASRILDGLFDRLGAEFDGLPDIAALARAMGHEAQAPRTPPLLLDGTRRFDLDRGELTLPLPVERLDFNSPWTTWIGEPNRA